MNHASLRVQSGGNCAKAHAPQAVSERCDAAAAAPHDPTTHRVAKCLNCQTANPLRYASGSSATAAMTAAMTTPASLRGALRYHVGEDRVKLFNGSKNGHEV